MIATLKRALRQSIRARLIAMTSVTVVSVILVLALVIALVAANILREESSRQQSQSLDQSVALLSNFLDVRESNLTLWASSPLVEAIFKDPALATVFVPSLRSYFAQAKAQEPWIAHIFLIQDESVIYDDSDAFEFSDGSPGGPQGSPPHSPSGMTVLAALPTDEVSVLNLRQLNSKLDQPVVYLKRPFIKDGKPVPGAYIVLLLDFDQIDQKLFGQIQIGGRGFVSVVARTTTGEMRVPPRLAVGSAERTHFLESSRTWTGFVDIPESYRSVVLKMKQLNSRPFAIVGAASLNDIREPVLKLLFFSGAFGLLALAGGIWSAFFLSGRLTDPILALTVKAEQLAHDNSHEPSAPPPEGAAQEAAPPSTTGSLARIEAQDELGRLASSFSRMQTAITEKIDVIESQNEKLRQSDRLKEELNQSLEVRVEQRTEELTATVETLGATLTELQAAQNQLVQAEKMASLGQLVTNVAHEINTPIGAVKSSGESITTALDSALTNMPRLFEILDPQPRGLFTQLVGTARAKAETLTTREERAIKNRVAQELEAVGIAHADRKARILVKLRAYAAPLDYLPLLLHEECDFILDTAQNIGAIISSTRNIHTAVDRVSKIVTTLKSFSQADTIGEMTDADLKDGIEAVLSIYSNQIKQNTELVRQYEELAPLRCLPDELKQVWTHLIHNALQAMAHNGKLTIGLRQSGNDVVVSVTDTGSGIAEDIRWRIFEPFFSTRAQGEGSGLGLDIAKKIVTKHRGRIDFQTEVGVGSTFSVCLPRPAVTAVV